MKQVLKDKRDDRADDRAKDHGDKLALIVCATLGGILGVGALLVDLFLFCVIGH